MERRLAKADVVTMMISCALLYVKRSNRDSVGENASRAHPNVSEKLVMARDVIDVMLLGCVGMMSRKQEAKSCCVLLFCVVILPLSSVELPSVGALFSSNL